MEASHPLTSNTIAAPTASHPLVLAAAASVTVLSLSGVAYLAGWLPGPGSRAIDSATPVTSATHTAPSPISVPQNVTVTPAQARPAAKSSAPRQTAVRRHAATDTATAPVSHVETTPFAVSRAPTPVAAPLPTICRECGVVESVQEVPVEAKGSGGGAIAGGIVGGIIGNQIGRGATRDIATLLGAVGGAYAGNHIEKSAKEAKRYDVTARFEDGSTRSFSGDTPPAWRSGDRVRLQNGTLISGGGRSATDLGTI